MDNSTLLQSAQSLLSPMTERFETPEPEQLNAYLPVEHLLEAVKAVLSAGEFYLATITGLDVPPADGQEGQIELLYHFCCGKVVVTLRTRVNYADPAAPSVCGLIPMATLYEREVMELFGVKLTGTPVTDKLLLPDDWPDGVYPLRKSFKGFENGKPVVSEGA